MISHFICSSGPVAYRRKNSFQYQNKISPEFFMWPYFIIQMQGRLYSFSIFCSSVNVLAATRNHLGVVAVRGWSIFIDRHKTCTFLKKNPDITDNHVSVIHFLAQPVFLKRIYIFIYSCCSKKKMVFSHWLVIWIKHTEKDICTMLCEKLFYFPFNNTSMKTICTRYITF